MPILCYPCQFPTCSHQRVEIANTGGNRAEISARWSSCEKSRHRVRQTMMAKKIYYQKGFPTEHCCVPLCGTTSRFNTELSFHSFPSDEELRKNWLVSVRRENFPLKSNARVCSRHFNPEDITDRKESGGRRRLKKGAVPVLFPWNNYCDGGTSDEQMRLELVSEEEITSVLTASHVSEDGYHYDIRQTTDIISARYYWPDMSNRIKTWVEECEQCMKINNRGSGVRHTYGPAAHQAKSPSKSNNEVRVSEAAPVRKEAQDVTDHKASFTTDSKKQTINSGNGGGSLQCPYCYFQCNTKCLFQIHVGSRHPLHCEDMSVGHLGKVIFYQRTAKLFHCYICFYTSKDYAKLFDHMLVKHSFSGRKDPTLELKHQSDEGKEECSPSKDSKDSDSSEVGHGEGSEQDKDSSPRMQPASLMDVPTKASLTEGPLKTKEGQSIEGGAIEDFNISGNPMKRKRSSASCSEYEDDEEDEEDELDSSQSAKEEKSAAIMKYTEHLSTRYYYCKFCKWRTKKKGFLLYHVSHKHDVPKPHACKDCSKTFMLETLLLKHVKMFHKQGLYQCPFCPFESNFLRGIRRHLNNCKGEEEESGAEGHIHTVKD
ncbi:chromosome alignment-maintaining phosphoprotein 1 [Astyanax mexicanus]|uniref:chromosome alignment-maintaining phosphoprotein 1 n=1 Tax=Astyanax mexicanus TaxID=7994 RepID=UPI0020CAE3F4|nr:chromosome alignment-maintaining phosphoprotein 1 [Astyanax mexicanus]